MELGTGNQAQRSRQDHFVFRWKPLGSPLLPKVIAVSGASLLMLFMIGSLRVELDQTVASPLIAGTLTYAADDAVGRHLAQLAREGGPFPSRFDPREWIGSVGIEQAIFKAAQWSPPSFQQSLAKLPEQEPIVLPMANPQMEAIRPPRSMQPVSESAMIPVVLTPRLHPLAGISSDDIPEKLPDFSAVDPILASEAWRFLISVDESGIPKECICLTGGDEESSKRGKILTQWLRSIPFPAANQSQPRWFALAVSFANSPQIDDADAR